MSTIRRIAGSLALVLVATGCGGARPGGAPASMTPDPQSKHVESGDHGLLIMAHGGSSEWNASVREAVAPISSTLPTAIAFGMADPSTLQRAVDQLEDDGVRRIAVVRLFVSGESFLHRTEYLFGLRTDPPSGGSSSHRANAIEPLDVTSTIELDYEGLIDGPEVAAIVRERATSLSLDPESEAVLLIGHGSGDESVNDRVLHGMDVAADAIRAEGFHKVRVETLREDWRDERELAEKRIRGWVTARTSHGYRVLVVPFRLSGFGPYSEVLEGLRYEADGVGFLPNPAITEWIHRRATDLLGAEALDHRF